jgi:hypothetical protein
MPITRESFWHSHLGKKAKIKDLDDTHIANLVDYARKNQNYWNDGAHLVKVLETEASLRNLSDKMVGRTQIPYQHNGIWYVWNFEMNRPEAIGGYPKTDPDSGKRQDGNMRSTGQRGSPVRAHNRLQKLAKMFRSWLPGPAVYDELL